MPSRSTSPDDAERRRAIGARIRGTRLAGGVSLRRMARELGMSTSWLAAIEGGTNGVDALRLADIAAYLGCPVGRLLGEPPAQDGVPGRTRPESRLDWQLLYAGEEERARAHHEVDRVFERLARRDTGGPEHGRSPGTDALSEPYSRFGLASGSTFPRTIRHAMGTTDVPEEPRRIVTLNTNELHTVVALGIPPVGYATTSFHQPDYIRAAVHGAAPVGLIGRAELRQIAMLEPDLILSNKDRDLDRYDELSALAPTVFGEHGGVTWQPNFALYALSLGREARASAVIERYEQALERLRALLPVELPAVSLVRVREDCVRYYQRNNFAGSILGQLGFRRPALQDTGGIAHDSCTFEGIREFADADVIVIGIDNGPENELARNLLRSRAWQSLRAVRQESVIFVDPVAWFGAPGYAGASQVLADIAVQFGLSA